MTNSDTAAWPNIALLAGDLYGLGASVSVPAGFLAAQAASTPSGAECRPARILRPCIATKKTGLAWLRASSKAGYKPAFTGHEVIMLRRKRRPKESKVVASR
jgi:hypothetical protein